MRIDGERRLPVWRAIFGQAWGAALADARVKTGAGLMVPGLLFFIYVLLVWTLLGPERAGAEMEDKLLLTAAPLLLALICYIFRILTVIPDREIDLGVRVDKLRVRLTPRFEIGTVRQAFTDNRNQTSEFLCLTVRNTSEAQSDLCEAHLTELRSDTGGSIIDPVELNWMGANGDQHYGTIPSGATWTVKVFRIFGDGLLFNMGVIPEPYRDTLAGAGTIIGKIAFDDRYWGGQFVHFVAHTGNDPSIEIVQTEAYTVKYQRDPEAVE